MRRLPQVGALLILMLAQASFAWSPKEYATLTRLAAVDLLLDPRTPPAMRLWLEEALGPDWVPPRVAQAYLQDRVGPLGAGLTGLAHWSVVPDLVAASDEGRLANVEPFGVPERSLHYLELERLNASPAHRSFLPDLSNKPVFRQIPRERYDTRYADAGMLPFRAQQSYQFMVDAIVAGRLVDKPGQYPRDDHAARWAGYLAHYVADSWEPQHATVDYRLAWFFRDMSAVPDVQIAFEGGLCDNPDDDAPELRKQYWETLVAARERVAQSGVPFPSRDVWEMSVQGLLYGYDFLPLIGQAAVIACDPEKQTIRLNRFYQYRAAVGDRQLSVLQAKAELQAMASQQIAQAWLRAWEDASRRLQVSGQAGPATQPASPLQ